MGKAMLDLPDPLEKPPTGSPNPASADDLLAQLAGEEIDRLLSEADARPADLGAPDGQGDAAQEEAASLSATATLADGSTPAPAAQGVSDVDLSQQLDDLFNQLVDAPVASEPTVAPTLVDDPPLILQRATVEAPTLTEEEPPPAAFEPTVLVPGEAGTSIAERSALDLISEEAEAVDFISDPAIDDEPRTPLWLRPLEWLNAPLDLAPDALREAIGKIALLTLFNAVAVLIYVLFFRKH